MKHEKDLGANDEGINKFLQSRGLLYLYFEKDNLNFGYIHDLKKYLLQTVNRIRKTLLISIMFHPELIEEFKSSNVDVSDSTDITYNLSTIQQVLNAVYNIFEPEYSKQFPMVTIAITLPQVFSTPVFPDKFKFDAFFFDSKVLSKEEFSAVLSENKTSHDENIMDIRQSQELGISTDQISEKQKEKSLVDLSADAQIKYQKKFKMTCLGGTFDHLHLGHKLLLTNACFYTSETLIIGITSSNLLSKKKCSHFIEDFETRKSRVSNFIKLLTNGKIEARIYKLEDPCGPAGEIEEIEALILTPEVAKGGDYCNGIREKNGLSKCEIVFVDMIENEKQESGESAFSNKTSSSYIRQYLDEKTGSNAKELYDRFIDFCDRIGLPQEIKLAWWTKLRDSYCTHWRYYFNLYHIYNILQSFDKYYDEEKYGKENKILIELVIWFHRIVFLPLDIDFTYNVEQSYVIVQKFIEKTEYRVITKENMVIIEALVMSVHRHRQKVEFGDEINDSLNKFFLDIILVFLGFDKEQYNTYKELVRLDYLWVEKSEFKVKRKIILQRLLDRERIFITDRLHEEFEEVARANLQNEIDGIE